MIGAAGVETGILSYAMLTGGATGLHVALGEVFPNLGYRIELRQELSDAERTLTSLIPELRRQGLDEAGALEEHLAKLKENIAGGFETEALPEEEIEECPAKETRDTDNSNAEILRSLKSIKDCFERAMKDPWRNLADIGQCLSILPRDVYSAAATNTSSALGFSVRRFEPSDEARRRIITALNSAKAAESFDVTEMAEDDLVKCAYSDRPLEERLTALEELRGRNKHEQIVGLLSSYPREKMILLDNYTGMIIDRPFKRDVFHFIIKYWEEFKVFPHAQMFAVKYSPAHMREALDLLVVGGKYALVAVIRRQAENQNTRWAARDALDNRVESVADATVLMNIGAYGKNLDARIRAVRKLGEMGNAGNLRSVATGEGTGWGWQEYADDSVIAAAKEELAKISAKQESA